MARTKYEQINFRPARLAAIEQANGICEEYADQGLTLTLRQLFYQHVARGLVENSQKEYNRLGELCRDARMAGVMDWDFLIDRTRNVQAQQVWRDPAQMLAKQARHYLRDLWKPQHKRVEVWIEKDAAIGVVENVCNANSVPYFSCRGYTSMSEMHEAAQRVRWHIEDGCEVTILHIGDHDPSGLDMSRDIEARLRTFISRDWAGLHMGSGAHTRGQIRHSMLEHLDAEGAVVNYVGGLPWRVKRIALNIDQIRQYDPPPNPAKTTDARFRAYSEETGLDESWELDALDPVVMEDLIQGEIDSIRDERVWAKSESEMDRERLVIKGAADRWGEVTSLIQGKGEK